MLNSIVQSAMDAISFKVVAKFGLLWLQNSKVFLLVKKVLSMQECKVTLGLGSTSIEAS